MAPKRNNSARNSSPRKRAKKSTVTTLTTPETNGAQKCKTQDQSDEEFVAPKAKKSRGRTPETSANVAPDSDVEAFSEQIPAENVTSSSNSDDEGHLTREEPPGGLGTPVRAPGESVRWGNDIEKRDVIDRNKQTKSDGTKAAPDVEKKSRRDEVNIENSFRQDQTLFGEKVNGKRDFAEFDGGEDHTPSKKIKATAINGPSNTAETAPKGREAYNVQYQGFPTGEIEFGRPSTAPAITWLAIHTADEGKGHILFSSADYLLGGPYRFLSRHEKARFRIPEKSGLLAWSSIEQYVLFAKARCLCMLPERISKRVTPDLSSKHLFGVILACDGSAKELVLLSTAFDDFRQSDPAWYTRWLQICSVLLEGYLRLALRARYEQHPDAKIKLMMTGTYGLGEATSFGIGFNARQALENRAKWKESLLGKVTEQVREEFRAEEPVWPDTYAFEFFQAMEDNHPVKTKDRIKPTTESQVAHIEKVTNAYRDWLALGGDKLKAHIETMRTHAAKVAEDEKTWCAKVEAERREAAEANLAALRGMRKLKIKLEDIETMDADW